MNLTLQDLQSIKEIVQETVHGIESKLRKEMNSMKSELKEEIQSVKTELRQEMKEMEIRIEDKLEERIQLSERNIIQIFGEIMSTYDTRLCRVEQKHID